jgi:UPF0755 protein
MTEDAENKTTPEGFVSAKGVRYFYQTVIATGLLFIVVSGYLAYEFEVGSRAENTTTLVVPKGASLGTVSRLLVKNDMISTRRIFALGVKIRGAQADLKAGEYKIAQGATMAQILSMMRRGDTVARRLSIPEGLSVKQIIARLVDVPSLTGDVTLMPAEGSLLPETYYYSHKDTRQEIVDRMQGSMREAVMRLWPERQPGLPLTSPHEAVILASIIEKETSVDSERAHIAGVFINRLNKGMKLQSDPTIIYGITGGEPLGRGLRRSELRAETPYNTYYIAGLPPTPISNPGLASLEAALNPLKTEDLFFVADGTGGHAFASTNSEHAINVRKWRRRAK